MSGDIVWEYENGEDFFSPFRSGNQRLPNGNTLICECDAGHLFEVTPEKEIVWDFYSPFVAQGDHENRTIEQTLDIGWDLMTMLPEAELKRIRPEFIEEFYRPRKKEL